MNKLSVNISWSRPISFISLKSFDSFYISIDCFTISFSRLTYLSALWIRLFALKNRRFRSSYMSVGMSHKLSSICYFSYVFAFSLRVRISFTHVWNSSSTIYSNYLIIFVESGARIILPSRNGIPCIFSWSSDVFIAWLLVEGVSRSSGSYASNFPENLV